MFAGLPTGVTGLFDMMLFRQNQLSPGSSLPAGDLPIVTAFYSTTFPATETPMSQGGIWTQGGTTGLDWADVNTLGGTPGTAYASQFVVSGFDDCCATMQGRFTGNKHYAQIKVRKDAGYTPGDTHEIECLVGFTIAAHSAKGYEFDFGFGVNFQPVRWNGPANDVDFSAVTFTSGTNFAVDENDVVKINFDSTSGSPVMTVYLNGVQQCVCTDVTAGKILTGSPGISFFVRNSVSSDRQKYAIREFTADNL